MKIEDFLATKAPAKRKSKLASFTREIYELKSRGYSAPDIQEWLKSKGVDVTPRAINKKIKAIQTSGPTANPTPIKEVLKQDNTVLSSSNNNGFKSGSAFDRSNRENFASQYISENPINSVAQRLINKEKS
ncbi:MAG: hypothetical protein CTY12_01970 [Methylotenera sp.]|nr:MAG: hypothetical protein CTY12_01970 [Methylotenera sp.]